MPDKITIKDVLPVGGGLIDTATSGLFNIGAAKRNRKFVREMYGRQRADALADWEKENAYNSPAAQMARLKEAGLNPNLIYGDGGSIMQSAAIKSASAGNASEIPTTGTRLGESLRQMYDIKLAKENITNQKLIQENLRKDLAVKDANIAKTGVDALNTSMQTKHGQFDLDRKNELTLQIIEDAWAATGLKKAQIDASVMANKRAEAAFPLEQRARIKALQAQDLDNARKKLDNWKQKLENGLFEIMRPLDIARARQDMEYLSIQIDKARSEKANTEIDTELKQMQADMGPILNYVKDVMGGVIINPKGGGGHKPVRGFTR